MPNARRPLTLAFLSAGLLVVVFVYNTLALSQNIGFLYGRVLGFGLLLGAARWGGVSTAVGFVATSAIVAVAVAARPATWLRRLLSVVPALLLFCALTGVGAYLSGAGAAGDVNVQPAPEQDPLATGWLALAILPAALSPALVVATVKLTRRVTRAGALALGFTSLAGVVLAAGTLGAVMLVANVRPAPAAYGERSGARVAAPGQAASASNQATPNAGGRLRGQAGPGGGVRLSALDPGATVAMRRQFIFAGGALVVLALLTVFSTLFGLEQLRLAGLASELERGVSTVA